jgi:hypothetical protein
MANGKDCIDVLSALLTPTIAILGSVIALQQWRTNRARLKHELFDRRYQQFVVVRDFLSSIMVCGKVKPEEEQKFCSGTRGVRFVFDKAMADYIEKKLWHLAIDLQSLEAMPATEELASRQAEIKNMLNQELRDLEERFVPYLQLQH